MSDIFTLLKEFCENNEECKYYHGYSGRGMFSRYCVGIVCRGSVYKQIIRLCDFLYENGVDSAEEALGKVCVDSLGLEEIVYFPEINSPI